MVKLTKQLQDAVKAHFRELAGRGGKARAANLSAKERKAIASAGAKAMHAKRAAKKKVKK
jgi:hypothetical protein